MFGHPLKAVYVGPGTLKVYTDGQCTITLLLLRSRCCFSLAFKVLFYDWSLRRNFFFQECVATAKEKSFKKKLEAYFLQKSVMLMLVLLLK